MYNSDKFKSQRHRYNWCKRNQNYNWWNIEPNYEPWDRMQQPLSQSIEFFQPADGISPNSNASTICKACGGTGRITSTVTSQNISQNRVPGQSIMIDNHSFRASSNYNVRKRMQGDSNQSRKIFRAYDGTVHNWSGLTNTRKLTATSENIPQTQQSNIIDFTDNTKSVKLTNSDLPNPFARETVQTTTKTDSHCDGGTSSKYSDKDNVDAVVDDKQLNNEMNLDHQVKSTRKINDDCEGETLSKCSDNVKGNIDAVVNNEPTNNEINFGGQIKTTRKINDDCEGETLSKSSDNVKGNIDAVVNNEPTNNEINFGGQIETTRKIDDDCEGETSLKFSDTVKGNIDAVVNNEQTNNKINFERIKRTRKARNIFGIRLGSFAARKTNRNDFLIKKPSFGGTKLNTNKSTASIFETNKPPTLWFTSTTGNANSKLGGNPSAQTSGETSIATIKSDTDINSGNADNSKNWAFKNSANDETNAETLAKSGHSIFVPPIITIDDDECEGETLSKSSDIVKGNIDAVVNNEPTNNELSFGGQIKTTRKVRNMFGSSFGSFSAYRTNRNFLFKKPSFGGTRLNTNKSTISMFKPPTWSFFSTNGNANSKLGDSPSAQTSGQTSIVPIKIGTDINSRNADSSENSAFKNRDNDETNAETLAMSGNTTFASPIITIDDDDCEEETLSKSSDNVKSNIDAVVENEQTNNKINFGDRIKKTRKAQNSFGSGFGTFSAYKTNRNDFFPIASIFETNKPRWFSRPTERLGNANSKLGHSPSAQTSWQTNIATIKSGTDINSGNADSSENSAFKNSANDETNAETLAKSGHSIFVPPIITPSGCFESNNETISNSNASLIPKLPDTASDCLSTNTSTAIATTPIRFVSMASEPQTSIISSTSITGNGSDEFSTSTQTSGRSSNRTDTHSNRVKFTDFGNLTFTKNITSGITDASDAELIRMLNHFKLSHLKLLLISFGIFSSDLRRADRIKAKRILRNPPAYLNINAFREKIISLNEISMSSATSRNEINPSTYVNLNSFGEKIISLNEISMSSATSSNEINDIQNALKLVDRVLLTERFIKTSHTKSNIIEYFTGKIVDEDVVFDKAELLVSLMCPLTRNRLVYPAKGKLCKHFQFFDAVNYISLNEKKKSWICPFCKKSIRYDDLEIYQYFMDVLKSDNLPPHCELIRLVSDGSWEAHRVTLTTDHDALENKEVLIV